MNKELELLIDERIQKVKKLFDAVLCHSDIIVEYYSPDVGPIQISIENFIDYTEELDSLQRIDDSSVRCGKCRQTIVEINDYFGQTPLPFATETCRLSLAHKPFLIDLVRNRDEYSHEDFSDYHISSDTAIELKYFNDVCFSYEEENDLIKRYLYFLSSQYKCGVYFGKFIKYGFVFKGNEGKQMERDVVIPPYTKAMDYYNEAFCAMNADIQYLSFYKVLEYFSPTVSKKEYYEEMNKRLDAMSVLTRSYEDINGLQELSKKYEKSLRDNEIPFTILSNCVDLETLFHCLPKKIQLRLKKDNGIRKDDMIDGKLSEIRKELGKILYDTRNSIVHAKSNYQPTGNECSEEDMHELNEFMDKLCQCVFVWNGRQAENYRLK